MNAFSWRVRRAVLGLRQRDVADRAGLSQSRYSTLERAEAAPTAEEAKAISVVLQVSPEIERAFEEAQNTPD